MDNPSDAKLRVIIPTKGITQIAKVLGEEEEKLEFVLKENQIAARSEHAVVFSRLVEGSFPNFEEVIPVNCERKATMGRAAFASAVRRASSS